MNLLCLICSAPDVPSNPSFISTFLILKLPQMIGFVVVVKSNCHKNASSFLQFWHFFSKAIGLEAKAVEESVLDH